MEDDVAKWGRLGGPCTPGLTRGRGIASFLVQRRSASAGLYYIELFRATSNYSLFFAERIAREPSNRRRVVLRMIYKAGCVCVALFLGQSEIRDGAGQVRWPHLLNVVHCSSIPNVQYMTQYRVSWSHSCSFKVANIIEFNELAVPLVMYNWGNACKDVNYFTSNGQLER